MVNPLTIGILVGFAYFFLVFLGHWFCRNYWVASTVVVLTIAALSLDSPNVAKPVSFALTVLVSTLGLQFVALRFGLLAFVTAMLPLGWLCLSGWTFDVRAWYATGPNLAVGVLLASRCSRHILRPGADCSGGERSARARSRNPPILDEHRQQRLARRLSLTTIRRARERRRQTHVTHRRHPARDRTTCTLRFHRV